MTLATWAAIEALQTAAPAPGRRDGGAGTHSAGSALVAVPLLGRDGVRAAHERACRLVLPLGTVVLLMVWERRGRPGARLVPLIDITDLALAAVVFLLIAVPWFLSVTRRARRRVPRPVFLHRERRAVRDRPLQRAAIGVHVRPGHPRRIHALDAVSAALGLAARSRACGGSGA